MMDVKTPNFLLREFCNHVYLGQWELARAYAFSIIKGCFDSCDHNKEILMSTLTRLCKNPHLVRSSWSTLFCPSYVCLLSYNLMLDLGFNNYDTFGKHLYDFNILSETFLGTSENVVKELSQLYSSSLKNDSKTEMTEKNISYEAIIFLKIALVREPIHTSLLINKMCICIKSKNLNSTLSNMHFELILNYLKSFPDKKKKTDLNVLSSDIYLLLSLIPDFVSKEDYEEKLKEIFLLCIELCNSGHLNIENIHRSLLGRSKPNLLQYFCELENGVFNEKVFAKDVKCLSKLNFIDDSGKIDCISALLWSFHNGKHFLQCLMDHCIQSIVSGEFDYFHFLTSSSLFAQLKPLFLILSWEECNDDVSVMNTIKVIKSLDINDGDSVLNAACEKFKVNISLMEKCIATYIQIFPNTSTQEIQNQRWKILSSLQTQSLLSVLHSVFELKNIRTANLKEILQHGQVHSSDETHITDETIYTGYIIMLLVMESINVCYKFKEILLSKKISAVDILYKTVEQLGIDYPADEFCLDNIITVEDLSHCVDNYGSQFTYSKFVVEKLENAKQKIKNLFPLIFRVEILENVFSMLFLMVQNLSDFAEVYDSDQGYEGEPSLVEPNDSLSTLPIEKKCEGRFIITSVKLKDQTSVKNALSENTNGHYSSKSTESNGSMGPEPNTFLCNELITRDLLLLLKDSILQAKAEVYNFIGGTDLATNKSNIESYSDTSLELPERTSRLLNHINEAIWRYEVVKTDIFRERLSVVQQHKNRPHLFESQISTSSSEGTDKDGKKSRRKKRHKRYSGSIKDESFAQSNIIQCMLSSPEALLRYSLWNGNLEQARQVIDLFNLKESDEAKELSLILDLKNTTKILNAKVKEVNLKKSSNFDTESSISHSLSSIKSAISFGLNTSDLFLIINEELSSIGVLRALDITRGVDHPELILGAKNINSILINDLAYTSDISIEISSSLLNSVSKNWAGNSEINDLTAKISRKNLPLIRGNVKTLNRVNSLLNEIMKFKKTNKFNCGVGRIFWPLQRKFNKVSEALPCFMGNFDSTRFQEEIKHWKKVFDLIDEFSILLEEEEMNEQKGVTVKDIRRENKLHMTYKALSKSLRELREWSSDTFSGASYSNYLSKLLIHLHQVTSAVLECKKQNFNTDSAIYTSDFSILKESPVELLKKIILQGSVTPEKIEKFAVRMKVDLDRVLAQACLPHVPLMQENPSIRQIRSSLQTNSDGLALYVLNMSVEPISKPRHPDLAARELLKDLLSMIQDTAIANGTNGIFKFEEMSSVIQNSELIKWMEECSELKFVDLDLLKSKEEKLAFFINVTNIAWLYVILLLVIFNRSVIKEKENNEPPDYLDSYNHTKDYFRQLLLSPNVMERIVTQKNLGFHIGQLGPISLFDLRYRLLHDQLPIPKHLDIPPFHVLFESQNPVWEKYMPALEPRSLFVLVEGLMYSPKIQVMYSEVIEDILDGAMKDYFDHTIHINSKDDLVELPELLNWYALDFDKDADSCIDTAPFEGLINLLSTLVRPHLSELFQELLAEDSAYNFSENIDSSGGKQLPFTLKFTPAITSFGILFDYNNDGAVQKTTASKLSPLMDLQAVKFLKDKCHFLTDLHEIIIQENPSQYLSELQTKSPVFNLLKHYQCMLPYSESSFSWLSGALCSYPKRDMILKCLESCVKETKWQEALLYLDLYLEHCDKDETDIELLKLLVLQYAACITAIGNGSFTYALRIRDPVFRANTVLQNVQKWSENSAVKALKYCLADNKIVELPDLYQSLKRRLKEILLYQKIVDASEMYGNSEAKDCVYVFNNWQEVADCCVWDQSRILDFINSCGKYELCVEWSELHVVNQKDKLNALSMNLIWYLSQDPPDEASILKVLDSIENPLDYEKLYDIVFPKVSSTEAKLCLVQYIVQNKISLNNHYYYQNLYYGLKMLSSLRSQIKDLYIDLAAHPYLLLEQMLMNNELKDAEAALNAVREDLTCNSENIPVLNISSVNQLIEDYASKALEVHFLDALLETSSSSTLVLSLEDSLISDEPFVMPMRVPTKDEWVPDAKVYRCQVCKEERFNMFTRRHHCRRCGRVVCANCSPHALIVEGYGNVKVRVCEDCYNMMTGSISVTSSSFDKRYRILSSMKSSPRNSPYQDIAGLKRRASSILVNQQVFRWILSTDSEQNASVRNEFSYEQAPSISLCFSILKLHTDVKKCAQFTLNLCDRLVAKIKPRRSGKLPLEVDYSLIISMIESLLVSAKVKCYQAHYSEGEALADLYSEHLDIMKLLVNANCRHLLPRECLTSTKPEPVRNLRNKLLEEERMSLALEVSTKFNLDKASIWSRWGLFCLKAGDWLAARSKFQLCLKVISDKNNIKQENPLLNKILSVLETSKCPGNDKAAVVSKALSSLKSIENGVNWMKNESTGLDEIIKKECLYYLKLYGTHHSTVRFYHRNNLITEALNYLTTRKCDPEIFVETLFLPALKAVQLPNLKQNLVKIDPTLTVWWNYLFAACRYLERLKYYNVLYELQIFMEDYVRAAKSSINFYLSPASSYKMLFERQRHLYNAKKHYEKYLSCVQEIELSSDRRTKNIKMIPTKEVESYIQIINMQEEVMSFLQLCLSQNKDTLLVEIDLSPTNKPKPYCPSTLFGNSGKKSEVVKMVLLNALKIDEGFELAVKLIKAFNLDATMILCQVGKELVKMSKKTQIPHFIACMKCFFSKVVKVDEITLDCISELNKMKIDAEDIIKMLLSDTNKINAYLMCDKLKSAYLLAIKLKSALDVRRVLVAAELSDQAAIQQICKKWLDANTQQQ